MVEATTPLLAPRSQPVRDARFAVRLAAQPKAAGITQQALASRARILVTQDCRYHAGISQPTLSVLRALTLALNTGADSLPFDHDERSSKGSLRLALEAVDRFTPEEQGHIAAIIGGALLRHHAGWPS